MLALHIYYTAGKTSLFNQTNWLFFWLLVLWVFSVFIWENYRRRLYSDASVSAYVIYMERSEFGFALVPQLALGNISTLFNS